MENNRNIEKADNAFEVLRECSERAKPEIVSIVKRYGGEIPVGEIVELYGADWLGIAYDGGNHPEYASTANAEVNGISVCDDNDFYVEIEGDDLYSGRIENGDVIEILRWLHDCETTGVLQSWKEDAENEETNRYVMGYSQSHSGYMVVYAKDLSEAEEKFGKGEITIEENE